MSDTRFDLVRCEDIEDELFAGGRSNESAIAARFQAYRREIAKCYAEIDRLEAKLSSTAPAPVPTWTPPAGFPLVRFISCNVRRAIQILDDSGSRWLDVAYMQKWFPAFDMPPDGSWRVCADDRAAYLGPNEVTQ